MFLFIVAALSVFSFVFWCNNDTMRVFGLLLTTSVGKVLFPLVCVVFKFQVLAFAVFLLISDKVAQATRNDRIPTTITVIRNKIPSMIYIPKKIY